MGTKSDDFSESLSGHSRVLLLGGLAIIAHGLSRPTEDADIWLDSMLPLEEWIAALEVAAKQFPGAYFWDLARREPVTAIRGTIQEFGVIRVAGLDRYVDVFRRPNQLEESDFEAAWEASAPHFHNIRLLEEAFLIATKVDSEREKDQLDIHFLEGKLRSEMKPALERCTPAEAEALLARYVDHEVALAATRNPDPAVRKLGLAVLRELAEGQNPFALEALRKLDL